MLTATPGDVWIDWSQFLIGKVEHSYSIVGGVFGRASQKRRSQFLIGKV